MNINNNMDDIDDFNETAVTSYFAGDKKQAYTILIAVIIGILAAYGAILFRYLIQYIHFFFFSSNSYSLEFITSIVWWKRLLLPASGALIVGVIVTKFAPEVKGSGIPEVIESLFLKGGFIRFRVLITKAFAAAITIGSGGSAGREGPIVHIGSAIGSTMGQALGLSAKRVRTFVACGAAAAISATFNAPFAGAIFSLEVLMGGMGVYNMPHIIISSVVASVVSKFHYGDFPAFQVPHFEMVSYYELLFYGGLGIAGGIISVLFIKSFLHCGNFFEKFKSPDWVKPSIGGLGVGIIALFFPHVFGVGYETINGALWNRIDLTLLIILLFAKLVATTLTLGSGGSGGIFAPSLFTGAVLGAAWGQIVCYFFPDLTASPGAYALIGMGTVVAAVTHAPISAILIIFELTNEYLIIPPLMLSAVIAYLLSKRFAGTSIYHAKLETKGVKLFSKKDVNLLRSISVGSALDTKADFIFSSAKFEVLLPVLIKSNNSTAIVIDENKKYIGTLELNDCKEILSNQDLPTDHINALDICDNTPYVLPKDNLDLVMHIMGKSNREEIAVCNNSLSKNVIGIISKKSVINIYNKRIFQEDLTGGFASVIDAVDHGRAIEIFDKIYISEIDILYSWIGKTLPQIDMRKKNRLEIILIHRENSNIKGVSGSSGIFPSPEIILQSGDRLLVVGTMENIINYR